MLKLGRVRLNLDPNPFAAGTFRQTLKLNDGHILFEGANNASLNLWIDVFNPVIHVELEASQDVMLNVAYESWRSTDRVMNLRGKSRAEQGTPLSSLKSWVVELTFSRTKLVEL